MKSGVIMVIMWFTDLHHIEQLSPLLCLFLQRLCSPASNTVHSRTSRNYNLNSTIESQVLSQVVKSKLWYTIYTQFLPITIWKIISLSYANFECGKECSSHLSLITGPWKLHLKCLTSINTVSSGKAVLCTGMLLNQESEYWTASQTQMPPQTKTKYHVSQQAISMVSS